MEHKDIHGGTGIEAGAVGDGDGDGVFAFFQGVRLEVEFRAVTKNAVQAGAPLNTGAIEKAVLGIIGDDIEEEPLVGREYGAFQRRGDAGRGCMIGNGEGGAGRRVGDMETIGGHHANHPLCGGG